FFPLLSQVSRHLACLLSFPTRRSSDLLFVAAAISMLLREFSDTGIILAVIFLNTAIGVIQEGKAVKAMEALKKITAPEALVKREDRKSTRLNSSHVSISYAVFCLKEKN